MSERDDTPPAPTPARDGAAPDGDGRGGTPGDRRPRADEPSPDGAIDDGAGPAGSDPAGPPREIGGQQGPEPTRYGDWEGRGRCTDF